MFDRPWIYHSGADWGLPDLAGALNAGIFTDRPGRNFTRSLHDIFGRSVLVTNLGRTALWLGLQALGFGQGEKIVVPSLVCPTVVLALLGAGCRPVFCDVDPGRVTVNLKNIKEVHDDEVRGVLVPHLFGMSAPIAEIEEWCRKEGLFLIDDAAQCFGSRYDGRLLGTYGDFGILSFGPFKAVSSLRGGALVSRHSWLVDKAADITLKQEPFWVPFRRCLTGYVKFRRGRYWARRIGSSVRNRSRRPKIASAGGGLNETFMLSGLDAEITSRLVRRTAQITEKRSQSAGCVCLGLKDHSKFRILGPGNIPYTKIPIFLEEPFAAKDFVENLRSMKIDADYIYKPLHRREEFKKYGDVDLPGSDVAYRKVVLLPNPANSIHKAENMVKDINRL